MWLKCSLYGEKRFPTLTGGYFLRALDNSNFFEDPSYVGSQLYLEIKFLP